MRVASVSWPSASVARRISTVITDERGNVIGDIRRKESQFVVHYDTGREILFSSMDTLRQTILGRHEKLQTRYSN